MLDARYLRTYVRIGIIDLRRRYVFMCTSPNAAATLTRTPLSLSNYEVMTEK